MARDNFTHTFNSSLNASEKQEVSICTDLDVFCFNRPTNYSFAVIVVDVVTVVVVVYVYAVVFYRSFGLLYFQAPMTEGALPTGLMR